MGNNILTKTQHLRPRPTMVWYFHGAIWITF